MPHSVRTIKLKKGAVTLLEPGIIRFTLNANVMWELEDAIETHKANLKLTNNGKYFVFIHGKHFFLPSKEAQKYAASKTVTDHRMAAVFVVANPGLQIFATLFQKFFKSKSPTRIFKSEAEALTWMRDQYKKIAAA